MWRPSTYPDAQFVLEGSLRDEGHRLPRVTDGASRPISQATLGGGTVGSPMPPRRSGERISVTKAGECANSKLEDMLSSP